MATERSPGGGGRLVAVSEQGNRLRVLTNSTVPGILVDRSPVFTRDGKTLIFASNRKRRSVNLTSLWVVSVSGETPRRLTEGSYSDRDPRISPDGKWLYFCSDREGRFQVYRAPWDALDTGPLQVEAITDSEGDILSPGISPDGKQIVYMRVDDKGSSSIWRSNSDGSGDSEQLSTGPLDMAPSWGRSGQIAFSSKVAGRSDMDLFLYTKGKGPQLLIDSPNTDETGARWSSDGRYLFAVGMYRSAKDGKHLLGSIIYTDMQERPRIYRVLQDQAAVESRIGLAIFPDFLDPSAMRRNPEYQEALLKVILQEAVRNEKRASEPSESQ